MGKSARNHIDKLQKLDAYERKLLFALKAYPGKTIHKDNWYAMMDQNITPQIFQNYADKLVRAGLVTITTPSDKVPSYRLTKAEDIPNFFVAEIPPLDDDEQNEKFITLEPIGGVEDLNIRFVMRTKDLFKYNFLPGRQGIFRFQDVQPSLEEFRILDKVPQKTICVEPIFAFSVKRDAAFTIASAMHNKSNLVRLIGGNYHGVVESTANNNSLKCDSIYRFKILPTFSPISPTAFIASPNEIYNPHAAGMSFADKLQQYAIPSQHQKTVMNEAMRVQTSAGPFIRPKANDNKFIISIDDAGTQCIDDAFTLERYANGYTQETYLIAVPLIFDMDSPLYQASLSVGQTLYAGKKTVCPTIPTVLSHGHASLHAGQDCPVLVVRSEYDLDGRLLDLDFKQTFRADVVRVNKNITPQEFKAAIKANDKRYTVYQDFMDARRALSQKSAMTPLRSIFNACAETGVIDANIVADRMVHANATAGKWFAEKGIFAGYRNMGLNITPSSYDVLRYKISNMNHVLGQILPVLGADCSAKHLETLLNEADKIGKKNEIAGLIHASRVMQSQYCAVNRGHMDLGVSAYATVSSAARRHVDYINQTRLFTELGIKINGAERLFERDYVQMVCDHLNDVQLRHTVFFQEGNQRRDRAIMSELSESIEPVQIAEITGQSVLLRYTNYPVSEYFNQAALQGLGAIIDQPRQELVIPSYISGLPERRYALGQVMYLHINKDAAQTGAAPFYGFKINPLIHLA